MERVETMDIKRIIIPALMLIVSLTVPFWIYGANGRFELSSVLFDISFILSEPGASVHFIPDSGFLLPSLLICTPCFLWLYMERDLDFPMLLGSSGLVMLVLTITLLLFLPVWAVIPWASGVHLAYVPEFIDLIPFSGFAFTIMVLLPLLWRGLMYPKHENRTFGRKIAATVLSILVLLSPMTVETFRWQGSDFNRSFFEGFALNSATWSLNNRVDGNLWGQGTWFYFSTSSIFTSLSLLLQILPGIIFAWFVCRGSFERRRIAQMLVAGVTHLLIVSIACIWLNYTASHAGIWIIIPFPALLLVGLTIAIVNYGYQWRRTRQFSETARISEEESLSQVMV